jgi:Siphovirus Gp157
METKSLYKINAEYLELFGRIELAEGVLTPELEEELIIKKSELEVKSIAYAEVIKQRESFNARIDDEIKRLQALKKQNDTLVLKLKSNLLQAVSIFGNYEAGFLKFSTRKSKQVVIDYDVNDLPKQYKTVKVTETADKVAIKKAIESGEEVYGCRLVENINLTIK